MTIKVSHLQKMLELEQAAIVARAALSPFEEQVYQRVTKTRELAGGHEGEDPKKFYGSSYKKGSVSLEKHGPYDTREEVLKHAWKHPEAKNVDTYSGGYGQVRQHQRPWQPSRRPETSATAVSYRGILLFFPKWKRWAWLLVDNRMRGAPMSDGQVYSQSQLARSAAVKYARTNQLSLMSTTFIKTTPAMHAESEEPDVDEPDDYKGPSGQAHDSKWYQDIRDGLPSEDGRK